MVDLNTFTQDGAWIGLYDDVDSWRWSYSEPNFYQDGEAEFRNWVSGEPNNGNGDEPCGGMRVTGEWFDVRCEESMKLVCSDVQGRNASFIFIDQNKKWADAQSFCREHHTDLASVRSTSELEQIKELLQSEGENQVWIGLYRNSWTWVDGSSFSYDHWASSEPNGPVDNCVAAAMDDGGKWEDWDCSSAIPFFCYGEMKLVTQPHTALTSVSISFPKDGLSKQLVKVKLVKLKLVKSSSLDLKDAAVLEDLLMKKLRDSGVEVDVKLSWRKQSGGEIFKKDEL
ncbi:C-type mannose receptor 2-like [Cyprinodon tularosa]|uniref:C-type mannose receptor 2-like n=1 Tax=Cyprinodon tularosa TaxID=77115 RepID=UPI0018E1F1BA|nr:C-type mannose receptor 2-like [Cyprinodon tularosa]